MAQPLKTDAQLWWEDFPVGTFIETEEAAALTEASIIDFAKQYDPQYFHTDSERAKSSMYGGLIASGWQTGAIGMRLICDAYMLRIGKASLGSPGIDELRWTKPVRPGDRLRLRMEVVQARASQSKPDRGLIQQKWEISNQAGEVVMTMTGWNLLLKRPA